MHIKMQKASMRLHKKREACLQPQLNIPIMKIKLAKPSLLQVRVFLLSALCFVLPMKASFVYTLSALLLIVLLCEGHFRERLHEMLQSKLCWAFVAYYCVFVLGVTWSEETNKAWEMVDRQTPILLFLLYWSSAESDSRELYVTSLIAGLTVCAILATYNLIQLYWFPEWVRGVRVFKGAYDTAPFVDRILYTPILALGAYLCLNKIFTTSGVKRLASIVVAALLMFNLSFSGGRAGMVMFGALFGALVFEHIKARRQAIAVCFIVAPLVLFTAYKTEAYFAQRVDHAISDIQAFHKNPNTSVGLRFVYWTTSLHVFAQHPFFGVGSGDFQKEYTAAKPAKWASTPDSFNPHNQFLMTGVTTGLLGLLALLNIFYSAVRWRADTRMISVLLGFAVVCLFESYLWRSNTALAFSLVVAVLAKRDEAIKRL